MLSLRLTLLLALLLWAGGGVGCRQQPPAPTPPPLISEPLPAHAERTLASLQGAAAPARDSVRLARQLQGITVEPVNRPIPTPGQSDTFWYRRNGETSTSVTATLVYHSDSLSLWVEEGARVRQSAIDRAAEVLENAIFPTTRAFFGHEAPTGIDGDPRIHILHLKEIGGQGGTTAVGYFYAADQLPRAVNPYSNERKLFYISLKQAPVGSEAYFRVIAHEFQHMVRAQVNPSEETWVDEGFAELSTWLNGYFADDGLKRFAARPATQLNTWRADSADDLAHYGASFLFATWFLEQFGQEALHAASTSARSGFAGFADGLHAVGSDQTTDQLFADWTIANWLNSSGQEHGPWRYEALTLPELSLAADYRRFPASRHAAVPQYGTDYIRVRHNQPLTVTFSGSSQVPFLPAAPHSGLKFWATLPADRAAMALTRPFDLRDAPSDTPLTLTFQTWYQIETGWDYGYLLVSADSGTSWQMLPTIYTTRANPQGNNYGVGITGKSGTAAEPVWTQFTTDLTPWAGQEILLRFKYITDDAIHEAGWAIDDIAIPALGYFEDFESGPGGWQGEGWVWHANILPQHYLLHVIYPDPAGAPRVERLPLDSLNQGRFTLPLDNTTNSAILVISGATPFTTHPAPYQLDLR
jgi:hypothetical protein